MNSLDAGYRLGLGAPNKRAAVVSATQYGKAASASATGGNAVAEACRDAVGGLGGDPGLVLAFMSGELDFDASAAALQESAGPGACTAGMTGTGLITADGPIDHGCVAVAFGTSVRAAVAAAPRAATDLRAAGRTATDEALISLGGDADLVLLFIDTTTGDLADAVSGAYEAAGPAIPLAGGAAGGPAKRFLHMGAASADSIVAVAIASASPLAVGNAQTSSTVGPPSIVTRSRGQHIEEIDGRPAEEVYLDQIGLPGVALSDEEFELLAMVHPLSQPELHGDVRLRNVLGKSGDGAIHCGTHIPAGAAIEFTELEIDQILESGARSVRNGIAGLGGADVSAALVFDCVGRRKALRDELGREVGAIASAAGQSVPLAGLYTDGEVARVQGAKGDRNHTVVTVAFG
jgi:hypothetical protein